MIRAGVQQGYKAMRIQRFSVGISQVQAFSKRSVTSSVEQHRAATGTPSDTNLSRKVYSLLNTAYIFDQKYPWDLG
jgi:hypothetical protein